MTSASRVSVVVATRDRASQLVRLLDRLERQTVAAHQVIVVDDGSQDATRARLETREARSAGRLQVVTLPRSRGPAAARNAGAEVATGEVLAFTDDDCRPDVDWLEGIVSRVAQGADVVVGLTGADPDEWRQRGTWGHWMVTEAADPMFSTCNIAYRRELFCALGGFDQGFRGSRGGAEWGEDTDLGWRAVEHGARVVHAPECRVEHDVVARGWWGYCLAGLRRQGVPRLLRKHPGFRAHLWCRVFLNPAHAFAPMGLVGLLVAAALLPRLPLLAPLALALAFAPYVHFRLRVWPLPARRRELPAVLPLLWVADLVETVAVLMAAGRCRVLVV